MSMLCVDEEGRSVVDSPTMSSISKDISGAPPCSRDSPRLLEGMITVSATLAHPSSLST